MIELARHTRNWARPAPASVSTTCEQVVLGDGTKCGRAGKLRQSAGFCLCNRHWEELQDFNAPAWFSSRNPEI